MDQEAEDLQVDIDNYSDLGYRFFVVPLMDLAQVSDDADLIRCAATYAMQYLRQRQLLGKAERENDPISKTISKFVFHTVPDLLFPKLIMRCEQHDPTASAEILAALRLISSLGGEIPNLGMLGETLKSCPPQLELDYNSEFTGTVPLASLGNVKWDATIRGSMIINGLEFSIDALTHITDPSLDLFTSYVVQGAGKELYGLPQLTFPPSGCNTFISKTVPDVLSVQPLSPNTTGDLANSHIKYKFDPHYDPQALNENGRQFCSFCPVLRKTSVDVALYLTPGLPTETIQLDCPDGSQSIPGETLWQAGWSAFHFNTPQGLFDNWDVTNSPTLLAQKQVSNSGSDQVGLPLTEKTSLQLKPCSQPPTTDVNGQQHLADEIAAVHRCLFQLCRTPEQQRR